MGDVALRERLTGYMILIDVYPLDSLEISEAIWGYRGDNP
nr:MAG TPA: hypothetical protein [Caudoviricetes sp.]